MILQRANRKNDKNSKKLRKEEEGEKGSVVPQAKIVTIEPPTLQGENWNRSVNNNNNNNNHVH